MPLEESGWLRTTDGRVEYRWIAPASNQNSDTALVLLHEGLGCIDLWRDFPDQLAQRTGFGVFAWSRIGYGRSDPCELPRPLTYMHHEGQQSLPEVLAEIDTENIVLIGHSDGASIATIHAGSDPDPRLRGMVLMAPHFFAEQVSIDSIEEAKVAYDTSNLREGLARYHGDNVDVAFRGWNDAWLDPDFRNWDLTEFLPRIAVPVLFIQGREDQYGSLAQLEALKEHLVVPLESRVLEECRHSPQRDQPGETLDGISGFLETLRSP